MPAILFFALEVIKHPKNKVCYTSVQSPTSGFFVFFIEHDKKSLIQIV